MRSSCGVVDPILFSTLRSIFVKLHISSVLITSGQRIFSSRLRQSVDENLNFFFDSRSHFLFFATIQPGRAQGGAQRNFKGSPPGRFLILQGFSHLFMLTLSPLLLPQQFSSMPFLGALISVVLEDSNPTLVSQHLHAVSQVYGPSNSN